MNKKEYQVFVVDAKSGRTNATWVIYTSRAEARKSAHSMQTAYAAGAQILSYLKNYTHVEVHVFSASAKFSIPDTRFVLHPKKKKKISSLKKWKSPQNLIQSIQFKGRNKITMQLDIGIKNFKRGTNILDINIPVQLERYVKTGVPWFDNAFGTEEDAGVSPSVTMLYTGLPGAGKTTSVLQLADGITRSGNICLYNTGEESLYQVRRTAKRLGITDGFVAGQDRLVDNMLDHAKALIDASKVVARETKKRQQQLFIICDSLQSLDDGKYKNGAVNGNTQVRVAERIIGFCKEHFAIAIIIGHVTKKGTFAGKQTIKHALDAHCHLNLVLDPKDPNYGKRVFKLDKNRFGPMNLQGAVLDMTAKGLVEVGKTNGDYEEDNDE